MNSTRGFVLIQASFFPSDSALIAMTLIPFNWFHFHRFTFPFSPPSITACSTLSQSSNFSALLHPFLIIIVMIPNYPIHNFYDLPRLLSILCFRFLLFYLLPDPFSTIYNLFCSTSQLFWLIEQLNGKQMGGKYCYGYVYCPARYRVAILCALFIHSKKINDEWINTFRPHRTWNIWKRRKNLNVQNAKGENPQCTVTCNVTQVWLTPKNRQK